MNILTIPYISGGLSHLIPLYILEMRYVRKIRGINNFFLVNNNVQSFFKMQNISCVPINYSLEEKIVKNNNPDLMREYLIENEKKAFDLVNPKIIIEDNSFTTTLIAEKNNIPRVSIQRTGIFRSIDKKFRNKSHVHSMQKGSNIKRAEFLPNINDIDISYSKDISHLHFFQKYSNPKVKIIPGIPSIERLPYNIENEDSYFYSGPLIPMDKPSRNLSDKLDNFLNNNKEKKIVFITTGTIDKTPIDRYIEFFVKQNYAVITTCDYQINKKYSKEIFFSRLLPLNYICSISNLVIHQCGSGMYHYPIINKVPSITIGTQCFDREDIALRLQELEVSAHIPHPEDNEDYWNIFLDVIDLYEKNNLINYEMIDALNKEIDITTENFNFQEVIDFALS